MSKLSVITMWAVTLLLVSVYFFPLWVISLDAPQYPEGLGMHIWIDKITGVGPNDLQNINGLNHYIGMRVIAPDAIPELRFMKFFLAFLIVFAAATSIVRRKRLLAAWVIVAVILAAVGMYDFYKWEYEYGHDLNPDAAIKVPGMTYQPPMFGTKQLLNFRTTAWPGPGGMAAMIGVGLGALVLFVEVTRKRRGARMALGGAGVVASILAGVSLSCGGGPQPIAYGVDQCSHCMMTISDDRYATEVVTHRGRAWKFDSIECMVEGALSGDDFTNDDVHAWYVTDYAMHGTLVNATTAAFLESPKLPSPMGANLTAFANQDAARAMMAERGGRVLDWTGVQTLLASAPGTPEPSD